MPAEADQVQLPDFENHPVYQHLFQTLINSGQTREQTTAVILDLQRRSALENERRQPQQGAEDDPQQQGQDNQPEGELPERRLPPNNQQPRQQDLPPPQNEEDQGAPAPGRADRLTLLLPEVDLDATCTTSSLLRPSTYVIDKFRKAEYVPLWYFTEQGCQAAEMDKAANEETWDVTKGSDDKLSLRSAATNRPNPNALNDEQLTWDQFMDGNHLLIRWLIPAGWPTKYAKVISTFFWQIENHEEKSFPGGKDMLLLYQACVRKSWHDELKTGFFYNLAKQDEKRMTIARRETDAKRYDAVQKAVSPTIPSFRITAHQPSFFRFHLPLQNHSIQLTTQSLHAPATRSYFQPLAITRRLLLLPPPLFFFGMPAATIAAFRRARRYHRRHTTHLLLPKIFLIPLPPPSPHDTCHRHTQTPPPIPMLPHTAHAATIFYDRQQIAASYAAAAQTSTQNVQGRPRHARFRDAAPTDSINAHPTQPHPYRRPASGSSPTCSFRTSSSENASCVVCLNRPHPNMGECHEKMLSDGKPAFSARSKLGHLVDRQAKSLCLDFQLQKGCFSKRHGTRHCCSGCGSERHGATDCPRRSSN